jgi:SAM-dependent methyltransferase
MKEELTNLVWTDPDVRTARCEIGRDHSTDWDIDRLVEVAAPLSKDAVLDLITSVGSVALAIAPHVDSVDALDPDEHVLDQARMAATAFGLNNINFIVSEPCHIPSKTAQYTLITARMALRHTAEPLTCLKEIHRVLKPGGRVILIDSLRPLQPELATFFENLQRQRDRSYLRSYNLEELETFLDREGFDVDLIEIFPREYDFAKWANRPVADPDKVRMLEMMFQGASSRAKRHFRIVEDHDRPVSFAIWMILIRAFHREQTQT